MNVLFIGKRFYTNKDALREQYGRIYQLPLHWAVAGIPTQLWLIDYHSAELVESTDGPLSVRSLPIFHPRTFTCVAAYAVREKACTHVVASGDCYIGLLGYVLARIKKAKFTFDVYDKYDAFPGYLRLPALDLFSFLLNRADQRLFASQGLKQELERRDQVDLLVPNGLHPRWLIPLEIHECRREFGLPLSSRYIGYFGGMEPDRGVLDLIAAVHKLREKGLEIEILLGGKACPDVPLKAPGVTYLGNLPFNKMPQALGACNLLAVPYRRSPFMDGGASNKIIESIASGKPLVATRSPNFLNNFPKAASRLSRCLAEPGSPADIAQVIVKQLENPVFVELPEDCDWASISYKAAKGLGLITNSINKD